MMRPIPIKLQLFFIWTKHYIADIIQTAGISADLPQLLTAKDDLSDGYGGINTEGHC